MKVEGEAKEGRGIKITKRDEDGEGGWGQMGEEMEKMSDMV